MGRRPAPPRENGPRRVMTVGLTAGEYAVLLEMMRRGGFGSPLAVIHAALWHYAPHFDIVCSPHLFPRTDLTAAMHAADAERAHKE